MRYNNVNMNIFLVIVTLLSFILLISIASIQPANSKISIFELKRRAASGDSSAERILNREQMRDDIISLQRVLSALLMVLSVILCVVTFGWLWGILVALFIALEYGAIARIKLVKLWPQKLYDQFETKIFKFVNKVPFLFKLLRSVPVSDNSNNWQISSREELQYLVDESSNVLTPDEKKLIVYSLSFKDKLVNTIMTPRSMIDSIKNTEFLGPLTLDELHKTGHSRLPVISGDIDHIIGILNLKNLLALDVKHSVTAEKAMEPKVYYIREDQTLQHALAAFLKTHHQLFVVVNEFRETVGLLSLEDVIEALIGQKIVDEFDAHDDLRAVALRNPRLNNHPEKREDV